MESIEIKARLASWVARVSRPTKTPVLLGLWMLLYFALAFARRFSEGSSTILSFGIANTVTQTLLDICIITIAVRQGIEFFGDRLNRRVFIGGFVFAALADSIYGVWVNVLGISDTRGTWIELAYNIPFNLFLSFMAFIMIRITLQKERRLGLAMVGLGLLASLLIGDLYIASLFSPTTALQTSLLATWSIVAESMIIFSAGFFFLFGKSTSTQLFSADLLVICMVNLLLQYLEVSGTMIQGIPFEAVWVLGQLSIFGAIFYFLPRSDREQTQIDFDFKNTRALFAVGLLVLMAGLHACWLIFFVSFGGVHNLSEVFLSLIFLSLAFIPITILFKSLFIRPVIRILETIYDHSDGAGHLINIDDDLRQMGERLTSKIVEAERRKIESETAQRISAQVAHDIRGPLAAMESVLAGHDAGSEKKWEILKSSMLRIQEIAKNLLSEIPQSSAPVDQNIKFSVMAAIRGLNAEKSAQYASRSGVAIELDMLTDEDLILSGDRSSFLRALSNIIDNAVEAVGAKGRITIEMSRSGNLLTIKVADNGVGIPAELMPRIGMHGYTIKAGGHGFGLSYATEVVKSLGGNLSLQSEAGKGTSVTIQFSATGMDAGALRGGQGERIDMVVIDDQECVRSLWTMAGDEQHLKVLALSSAGPLDGFMLPLDTPIYVDKNLGQENLGLDVVAQLHDRGFTNLYLQTGDASSFEVPNFLKGVVGKAFPLRVEARAHLG